MGGYLSRDGRYIDDPNLIEEFFNRSEIASDHPHFAETLATTGARPVWYGLSRSEVAQAAFGSLVDTSNWESFLKGAASYPVDVGWCGYGIAAATGLIGQSAQARVSSTGQRVWDVVHEAYQTAASGPQGLNKLAFVASIYVNYLATGGIYGTAGGFLTQQALAFFMARGFIPAQMAIAENPWFNKAMFAIVTGGSIVRLGEKFHDHVSKTVNDLSLTDFLISATTGEDDPDTLGGIDDQVRRHAAELLDQLFYDLDREQERYDLESITRESNRRWELHKLASDIRSTYRSPDLYDALIRAHNFAVRELRNTPQDEEPHPSVRYFVQLADPTVLHYMRLVFFFIANVVKHLDALQMTVLHEYDFWELLEREASTGPNINNPDYILPIQN